MHSGDDVHSGSDNEAPLTAGPRFIFCFLRHLLAFTCWLSGKEWSRDENYVEPDVDAAGPDIEPDVDASLTAGRHSAFCFLLAAIRFCFLFHFLACADIFAR